MLSRTSSRRSLRCGWCGISCNLRMSSMPTTALPVSMCCGCPGISTSCHPAAQWSACDPTGMPACARPSIVVRSWLMPVIRVSIATMCVGRWVGGLWLMASSRTVRHFDVCVQGELCTVLPVRTASFTVYALCGVPLDLTTPLRTSSGRSILYTRCLIGIVIVHTSFMMVSSESGSRSCCMSLRLVGSFPVKPMPIRLVQWCIVFAVGLHLCAAAVISTSRRSGVSLMSALCRNVAASFAIASAPLAVPKPPWCLGKNSTSVPSPHTALLSFKVRAVCWAICRSTLSSTNLIVGGDSGHFAITYPITVCCIAACRTGIVVVVCASCRNIA